MYYDYRQEVRTYNIKHPSHIEHTKEQYIRTYAHWNCPKWSPLGSEKVPVIKGWAVYIDDIVH